MTIFRHKIMWAMIVLTFLMCMFLIYLLMTGSYTSPMCIKTINIGVGLTNK
jgi:hypothetical protein